jgi:hypothetical protein
MQYIYNACKADLTYTCRNGDQVVNVSHTKQKVLQTFIDSKSLLPGGLFLGRKTQNWARKMPAA